MVLHHVLVHVGVILSDVSLCTAVWDRSKAERRGVGVGALKLRVKKQNKYLIKEQQEIKCFYFMFSKILLPIRTKHFLQAKSFKVHKGLFIL